MTRLKHPNSEKESIHRPASVQNFPLPKKKGGTDEDFGGGFGFSGFHRVFVSTTTDLESFSLRPEKFPKGFSFGGGRVRFFLLCQRRPPCRFPHALGEFAPALPYLPSVRNFGRSIGAGSGKLGLAPKVLQNL